MKKLNFKKINRLHRGLWYQMNPQPKPYSPIPILPYDPQSPSFKLNLLFFLKINKYGVKII